LSTEFGNLYPNHERYLEYIDALFRLSLGLCGSAERERNCQGNTQAGAYEQAEQELAEKQVAAWKVWPYDKAMCITAATMARHPFVSVYQWP
jgi:hypothetical protein